MKRSAAVVLGLSAVLLACSSVNTPEEPAEKIGVVSQELVLCEVQPNIYMPCLNGYGCCNHECVNLQTNNANCGACGNACGRPLHCGGGHCCTTGKSWCATTGACTAACDCPPDLAAWLTAHPNVSAAIKWQVSANAAYEVPEYNKQPWASWPPPRKLALTTSFNARYTALCKGLSFPETLPDPPPNLVSNIANDGNSPHTQIDATIAEAAYIAQVAHSLAVELGGFVPWSVTGYDSQSLAVLFDSAAMMRRVPTVPTLFSIAGWYSPYEATKRENNLGHTLLSPPAAGYALMKGGLLASTRHASIVNAMQWAHDNMVHFQGPSTFLNHEQHWGYRGLPSVSAIIDGTASSSPYNNPNQTPPYQHWTAGCHGTAGFFRDVLRTVNIPVQIPHVCGHSQIYFRTEGLYVDHADNLYSGYGAFPVDMEYLLVDQPTYTSWFGDNLQNEDWAEVPPAVHCTNVARRIKELTP